MKPNATSPTCWKISFVNRFGNRQVHYDALGYQMTKEKLAEYYESNYEAHDVKVEKISAGEYARKKGLSQ